MNPGQPVRPARFVAQPSRHGRLGELTLRHGNISTPCLFPVVCFMTGSTAVGGGLWKYILQADHRHSLLRRNLPVMSQVLHFLDFHSLKLDGLNRWRHVGLRERYNAEVFPTLKYTAPIFLDSGGFKLLWNDSVDLSAFGLSIRGGNGPRTIVDLQRDLGGDMVATLDYPLPPGLAETEARERMALSLSNAVDTAHYLQEMPGYKPMLFVAVHGQDRSSIAQYVRQVFERFSAREFVEVPFGLAVGSLVPLRGSKKYPTIIDLIRGVQDSIPDNRKDSTPIHVFGVTGNLVPLLAYLGVDSFDSSTYVQEARSLGYINPESYRSEPVLELEDWVCTCSVCRSVGLRELQESLTSAIRNKALPNGNFKSKYYGDIALHNLEMDYRIVQRIRAAISQDAMQEFLVEHCRSFPTLAGALDFIAVEDDALRTKLSRKITPTIQVEHREQPHVRQISLKYSPDSFNILGNGYTPPKGKRILLIIPCSEGKPYSESRSHRLISERLKEKLHGSLEQIHIVTLSGLYGPVPAEHEKESAVLGYDFRLESTNVKQIELVTQRMVEYLQEYGNQYVSCAGYATSLAYRSVLEAVSRAEPQFVVLPTKLKSRRLTEFFRKANVSEMVQQMLAAIEMLTVAEDTSQIMPHQTPAE